MVATGVYWPPKPLRDRSEDKPLKLIKHERTRHERCVWCVKLKHFLVYSFHREAKIAENMKNMPKMIEDYREKMRALRKATRDKKALSDEKKYLRAIGKTETSPMWEVFKEERMKKSREKTK